MRLSRVTTPSNRSSALSALQSTDRIPDLSSDNPDNATQQKEREMTIRTKKDLVDAVSASGSHFFDAGAMAFFDSRLESAPRTVDGVVYFVTSEQFRGFRSPDKPRGYTIKSWTPGQHRVETLDLPKMEMGYGHFMTKRAALVYLRSI